MPHNWLGLVVAGTWIAIGIIIREVRRVLGTLVSLGKGSYGLWS